jgi:hypothetical protein
VGRGARVGVFLIGGLDEFLGVGLA